MKKRFLTVILALVMLVLPAVTARATGISDTSEVEIIGAIPNMYRIRFQSGLLIDSAENLSNLSKVSGILREVVYTVDAGIDTFSIGYVLGPDLYSRELMVAKLQKEIDSLNYDILNEPKLSGNAVVDIADLNISYIQVEDPIGLLVDDDSAEATVGIISTAAGLVGVEECHRINNITPDDVKTTQEVYVAERTIDQMRNGNAIDGSYHYWEHHIEGSAKYWYNCLTGSRSLCSETPTHPHCGDGHSRYALGYQWFPDDVQARFVTDYEENVNRAYLYYKFDSDTLENLVLDSDEALEMEIVFYNIPTVEDEDNFEDLGLPYMTHNSSLTWVSNVPKSASYRDTDFGDTEAVSFSIGVDDASVLTSDHWYFWAMSGDKGVSANNYAQDGRFVVNAQRSYNFVDADPVVSGAWTVFAEEHEGIRALGITENQNWVVTSAWNLAATDTTWVFDADTDPVK